MTGSATTELSGVLVDPAGVFRYPDGNPTVGFGLLPTSDLTVEDTWHVAGMAGTGSNTVIANEVFVPDHRVMAAAALMSGQLASTFTGELLYRAPVMTLSSIAVAESAVLRAADEVTLAVSDGREPGLADRTRIRAVTSRAVQAGAQAIGALLTARGHRALPPRACCSESGATPKPSSGTRSTSTAPRSSCTARSCSTGPTCPPHSSDCRPEGTCE